jgi:hypothetical protein
LLLTPLFEPIYQLKPENITSDQNPKKWPQLQQLQPDAASANFQPTQTCMVLSGCVLSMDSSAPALLASVLSPVASIAVNADTVPNPTLHAAGAARSPLGMELQQFEARLAIAQNALHRSLARNAARSPSLHHTTAHVAQNVGPGDNLCL